MRCGSGSGRGGGGRQFGTHGIGQKYETKENRFMNSVSIRSHRRRRHHRGSSFFHRWWDPTARSVRSVVRVARFITLQLHGFWSLEPPPGHTKSRSIHNNMKWIIIDGVALENRMLRCICCCSAGGALVCDTGVCRGPRNTPRKWLGKIWTFSNCASDVHFVQLPIRLQWASSWQFVFNEFIYLFFMFMLLTHPEDFLSTIANWNE